MAATGKSKYKGGILSVFDKLMDKEVDLLAQSGTGEATSVMYLLVFMLFLKHTVTFEDTVLQLMSGFASPVIAVLSYFPESTIINFTGATALQQIFTWIGYAAEAGSVIQAIQFISLIIYSVMLHSFTASSYTVSQHATSFFSILFSYILPYYVQIMMPLQAFRAWAPLNYVNYRAGVNIP